MTRGNYQTKQQDAVEKLFLSVGETCLTAEEVYHQLTEKGLDIGQTTVYRVITRLCREGRLRKYASHERGTAAHYQYNPCAQSHLHIRCVECGALEHLHCDEVEAFSSHLTNHHGFTLDEAQTILYGRCQACRAADHSR